MMKQKVETNHTSEQYWYKLQPWHLCTSGGNSPGSTRRSSTGWMARRLCWKQKSQASFDSPTSAQSTRGTDVKMSSPAARSRVVNKPEPESGIVDFPILRAPAGALTVLKM